MNSRFVILHISDAHLGNPKYDLDSKDVLEPLFTDLKKVSDEHEIVPNLLVFSGDLAYGEIFGCSLSKQYGHAEKFLDRICNIFTPPPEVLLVPGNHDINRNKVDISQRDWLVSLNNETDVGTVYSLMQDNNLQWVRIIERQNEWSQFAQKYLTSSFKLNEQLNLVTGVLKFEDVSIGVAGLNSSWAAYGGDEDANRLWIGKYQLQMAFREIESTNFRIAVSHHPASWLNRLESNSVERRIESDYKIFFHGHEHNPWFKDSNNHLTVAAGACYQGSTKKNAYSWTIVDFQNRIAKIILRTFNPEGSGRWIPDINTKTDDNGIAIIKHLFDSENNYQDKISDLLSENSKTHEIKKPSITKPKTVIEFLSYLENKFSFRWEPSTFHSNEKPIIYWPVKLRAPTPIHAVQCFTAAGLQQLGCEINLWIDDLGNTNTEYPVNDFLKTINKWFSRVGISSKSYEVRKFSEVLNNEKASDIWPIVQDWIGMNQYHLEKVLKISKIWPYNDTSSNLLEQIGEKKPRRILTPAMVWTGLVLLSKELQNKDNLQHPIITLGGYDERSLWKAWRECTSGYSLDVGHLYVPELKYISSIQDEKSLHMSEKNLAWDSKEDIRIALQEEMGASEEQYDLTNVNRMIPWCLQGCVLLPCAIKEENCSIVLEGNTINSIEQLKDIDGKILIPKLVEELAKWLL